MLFIVFSWQIYGCYLQFEKSTSLSDAEVFENIIQGILACYALSKHGIEAFDYGTEVFGNEVAGELGIESEDDIAK